MLKADIQNGPHIERTRWSLSRGRKAFLLSVANWLPAPGKWDLAVNGGELCH
jgi:hypothetical protein